MIIALEGEVVHKEPTLIHLKLPTGITYLVHISLNCSAAIDGKSVKLHTTQIFKEDNQSLYGFVERDEKEIFDRVIRITGIGPSTALAIFSTFKPEDFAAAVMAQDVTAIKGVPGIGPKSAKRLLVELGDFNLQSEAATGAGASRHEAALALESLGFKKERIQKVLATCKAETTEALIKEALKKLT
ncbi:MAG TPA: Holliday junction branch migration protein RuvA [Campylobacteraceae bacterium]|nr:Holliday junction branch migration protein RuvA [Campylobacteraceae bacterium]